MKTYSRIWFAFGSSDSKFRCVSQKLKSRVIKQNTNPEWDDDLTLSITDPGLPVKVLVYDKDTFSLDDKMGMQSSTSGRSWKP